MGQAWHDRPTIPGTAAVCAAALSVVAVLAACGTDTPASAPPPPSSAKITDFAKTHPEWLTNNHVKGRVSYRVSPPVGGDHNARWQNCTGEVYSAAIANEHAVHSLEHGAVWITYRPDLPAADVDALAARVRGRNYLLMSPYPGLATAVSVQAWGFQLTTDSATDSDIDAFIAAHRQQGPEPGAPCSGGVTTTGAEPTDQ